MKTLLNIEQWNRKEHFDFFRKFEDPFFGATVTIDCTRAYKVSKLSNHSFFLYYLHKTVQAANMIEPFRYRISGDEIHVHDQIHVSATISRDDDTFGFSLIEYHPDFTVFAEKALIEIERVKNTPGLFTRTFDEDNLLHFSAVPWLDFTSLSHARNLSFPDSCPKISLGKMTISEDGKRTMPLSIHAHHGLMDGFHLGQFIDCFQELMNK